MIQLYKRFPINRIIITIYSVIIKYTLAEFTDLRIFGYKSNFRFQYLISSAKLY